MPEKLEKKLKAEAASKGLSGERANAFIYGTMRKTGWKPKREMPSHTYASVEKFKRKHKKIT